MKKLFFGLLAAAFALFAPSNTKAQTLRVDLVGSGTLCGDVVITYWAVDPRTCAKTESIAFTISPGSGTFSPNLSNSANWSGGVLPPPGFIVEGCRVDYGCGIGALPPATSCPQYDHMHLSDPGNRCLNTWPTSDCFEESSGTTCGTCGAGSVVNGSYSNSGGVVTITVW